MEGDGTEGGIMRTAGQCARGDMRDKECRRFPSPVARLGRTDRVSPAVQTAAVPKVERGLSCAEFCDLKGMNGQEAKPLTTSHWDGCAFEFAGPVDVREQHSEKRQERRS